MQRKSGELLAVVMVFVALVGTGLLFFAMVAAAWEYQTNKRAARARSIKVLQQIEAREAERRSAELSTDMP